MRLQRSAPFHSLPFLIVLLAAAVLRAADPSPLPSSTPWDVAALKKVPLHEVVGKTNDGMTELLFRGPAYKNGAYTKVFAYYRAPSPPKGDATAQKYPALVLVHGWAGQAMRGWVAEANKRGYAAIALSTNGRAGESGGNDPRFPDGAIPEEFRGPGDGYTGKPSAKGESPFAERATDEDRPSHRWVYHAAADIVLAHSLVRTFAEVDADHVGLWGISWGGFHTCTVAGLDDRFKAAVPQYGCGFLADNGAWAKDFARMKQDAREAWVRRWDPSNYVGATRVPILFFNSDVDPFYPLDSMMKTYALVAGEKHACVERGFGHGHFWDKRAEPVWRFLGEKLQGGPKLPTVSRPVVEGDRVSAVVSHLEKVERPILFYTTGPANENGKRKWIEVPLEISAGHRFIGQAPPANATAYYIGVSDLADATAYVSLATSEIVTRNRE